MPGLSGVFGLDELSGKALFLTSPPLFRLLMFNGLAGVMSGSGTSRGGRGGGSYDNREERRKAKSRPTSLSCSALYRQLAPASSEIIYISTMAACNVAVSTHRCLVSRSRNPFANTCRLKMPAKTST